MRAPVATPTALLAVRKNASQLASTRISPVYKLSAPSTLLRVAASAASLAVLGFAMAGCATGTSGVSDVTKLTPVGRGRISGILHGGQQPVVGSHVTLMAAVTTGYGVAASSILNAPGFVLTDALGSFTITGDYTCPTNTDGSSAQVYILASGGDPGLGTNNSALKMMAALGSCASLQANAATTSLTINEVTTVASVYALSGFMTSPTAVSTSGTAAGILGLTNAFANTNLLANTATGSAYTQIPSGNAVAPLGKVNALANAISACVNSDGSTAAGRPCNSLFAATTVGASVPTDTVAAVLNIAHNPAQNVVAIYNLQPGVGAPFASVLSSAPNDWMLPLTFTGGGLNGPQAVAIDGSNQAWVVSKNNTYNTITPAGTFLSGANGATPTGGLALDAPSAIAISSAGTIWVANCGSSCSSSGNASSLTQIPNGSFASIAKYSGNGLNAAYSTAVDGGGNVWAGNTFGNTITELSSVGVAKSGATGYAAGGLNAPIALALDTSGNAWIANPGANSVTKLNSAGVAQSGAAGYTGGGLTFPYAIAIDHSGNVWIANHTANSVTVLSSTGAVQSGASGYTGAGLNLPNALALDGDGNAWVVNANNSISSLTLAGVARSGTSGYTAGFNHANGVAVDGSGNVWVTSCGSACAGGAADPGSVVEFIGAGAPVATPLAAGAGANKLGARP